MDNGLVNVNIYENRFNEEQAEEIALGIEHNIAEVYYYSVPYMPAKLMRYFRLSLEKGLTIEQIHDNIADKL